MGFELNRLMRELGVSTPTIAPPPAEATDATKAAYDRYRQEYLSRAENTPQYLQAQFDTTQRTPTVPAGV